MSSKKIIPKTDIFNYKSKEFLLNLKPSDIPTKKSINYNDFILHEEEKCIAGVNINGIHIPGSLYFELNHWKIKLDILDKYGNVVKQIGHPKLKDNSWIIHDSYEKAFKQKKILVIGGSRQSGKTVTITSLLGRQMALFPNTFSLGLYANSKDQEVNAGYLEVGLENLEYLKIPRLDKNWKGGLIRLGYKQQDNTDEVWSTLYMRNTEEGRRTETGAGTTLNFFIYEEIAKAPCSKAMEAVKPALISEFGLRCSPIYVFTGGDVEKSKDAENLFMNPIANDILAFENEGKNTGLFLGGWYRQDFKQEKSLAKYLDLNVNNSELNDIKIQVTDFDLANTTLDKEQDLLKTDPDKSKYLKHRMYYPRSIQEMFLSENENPFPREALEQQKQFLLSNPIGQSIELFRGLNGNTQFKFSNKLPISSYPVQTGDNLDAPIVMYDSPDKFKGQKGIHIISCLPTGEKVMTNSGLQNIENVKLTDKLINENGNLVNIKNIQIHSVKKENIFQFKLTNTLRTTTFTGEHPLLVSENKTKYVSIDKWKRLEIKQRYKSYDFKFKKAENIKEKEWLKIPNLFNKEILPNFDLLWNDFKCNNCKKITNPLEDKDFWWLVGLWLGDGWIFKNGIQFVFNNKEIYYIEKFKKVSEKLFNKTPTFCKDIGGAITFSIYSKQIRTFFLKNLGEYSYGKKISEWIKYLPKKYKLEIVKGYLNSDGCVSVSKKNKGLINFVSINLELLESVQDILFSTGIISSIKLLRNEGFVTINKKVSKTKRCYTLDLCLSETINLLEQLYEIDDPKTSKLNILDKNIKKRDSGCRFDETKDYIYFQITDITKGLYTGDVYNFECDTHTFCSHHITTHNCDTFNDDEAPNSDSLGSIYVIRKYHSDLSDPFNGCMVASYTARPKTMKEFNKTCLMLAEFYDGQIMYEHTGGAFKDFFEGENKLHLLIDTPSLTKEISPNSKAGNTKGLRATPGIQKHALNLTLDYLNEELPNGQLGTTRIMDTLLIDEMLAYDGVKNTDRYIAFSMGMEALYMYKKYTTIVNYQEENVKPEPKVKFDAFGNIRKSNSWSNAFGF
jgi:intein-encoded DNA endonuclease-like protein